MSENELGAAFRDAVEGEDESALYERAYGATVRQQHDDDTVDLEVDSAELGVITEVPLRVGISGARVLVAEGTRVRLAFEEGDPEKPFAFGIEMSVDAERGVARLEDAVDVGVIRFVTSTLLGPSAFSVQQVIDGLPQGVPLVVTLGVDGPPKDLPLVGVISSASEDVLLE